MASIGKLFRLFSYECWFETVPVGSVGTVALGSPSNHRLVSWERDGDDLFIWIGARASLVVSKAG